MKYSEFAHHIEQLDLVLRRLTAEVETLPITPASERSWFELLTQKLLPQVRDHSSLIVAVVGGTNIGKSVVFNHLAGSKASATSPLASGTKHPTCLVPKSMEDTTRLEEMFQGFECKKSDESEDALLESDTDYLFWRVDENMPDNLLILDTPDIDSDAEVNWDRADKIRRASDVLLAVLTQQKYNDAQVKRFFRNAGSEKKLVIIVFNQCLLPEDEEYWPHWIKTFCDETQINPEHVYLAPHDRRAAEANELPFYERQWPIDPDVEATQTESAIDESPRSLLDDLAKHRFEEIKLQTMKGSVEELLNEKNGLASYLKDIEVGSDEFRRAADILSSHKLAEVDDWPMLPSKVLVQQIRTWWSEQREGWSASVHGLYNAIGTGLVWPIRFAKDSIYGESIPPLEEYKNNEWAIIVRIIEKLYTKLTWLSELDNNLLKPRLEALLKGKSRQELFKKLEEAHKNVNLQVELNSMVETELEAFRKDSPDFYKFFKRLDNIAAAGRPVTSVILFVTGIGPIGNAVTPFLAETAAQTALHVAGDLAAGTVTAAVGETAIAKSASSGIGYLEARFRQMHEAFIERRAAWLAEQIRIHLLGDLVGELREAAQIPLSQSYQETQNVLDELKLLKL